MSECFGPAIGRAKALPTSSESGRTQMMKFRTQRGRSALTARVAIGLTVAMALVSVLGTGTAFAAKQVYSYFGTPNGSGSLGGEFTNPNGIAVNQTGTGPAEPGEIYVVDGGGLFLGSEGL